MLIRADGRRTDEARALTITPHFTLHAAGSVLVQTGETRVLCTVSIDEGVPSWMRAAKQPGGWLTAEYAMLPTATHSRTRRERHGASGRTHEIQRLIGRSLRGILDLSALPEVSLVVDCDVLQADGGTRTAALTGSYVALRIAIDQLLNAGRMLRTPLRDGLAAVAIGLKGDALLLDLTYEEDSNIDVDMNIVMTHKGALLELQGSAERGVFHPNHVHEALALAQSYLTRVAQVQNDAARSGKAVHLAAGPVHP